MYIFFNNLFLFSIGIMKRCTVDTRSSGSFIFNFCIIFHCITTLNLFICSPIDKLFISPHLSYYANVAASIFFLNFYLFIYLFMAVLGLRFCARAFSSCVRQVGAPLHHGARASHYRGLSCCGAQAPDAQAQ